MQKTLAEIAEIVNGVVVGDQGIVIEGLSGINEAKEGDLTFLANSKYLPLVKNTKASAILVSKEMDVDFKCVIKTDNPSAAFAHVAAAIMGTSQSSFQGIHQSAIIGKSVSLGKNVTVGPNAVIEDDTSVGDDTVIYGGCYIGKKVSIGAKGIIYPNVVIREAVEIGNGVIVHSSTVIGSDGFGYVQVDGKHQKIPQFGIVVIEDDVEIGANVTIDRARFDKTRIGRGTKIDNLVQIAHNVEMDEDCIIVSQVGISGSVKIGKGAILAGQAGVAGHLSIGEGAVVSAQTGVTKSIPAKTHVTGFPAKEHKHASRVNAALQRLPKYVKEIQDLKERIKILESLK